MNKYISIKISGNQYANSGYNPLVWFNSPPFILEDKEFSGFDKNPYYFSVRIENACVIYKLHRNRVKSNKGLRDGKLVIGISIPKGYRLAGGKTPYDVLVRLMDTFMSSCMTCTNPNDSVFEFNEQLINYQIFDELAMEYVLEPYVGPYYPMSGSNEGYIVAEEKNIKLLMSDVQYSCFSSYKEVIIAESAQTNTYKPIVNLSYPRQTIFRIFKDGLEDGSVSDVNEEITIKGNKNPAFYENRQFSFTIEELRTKGGIDGISIEEESEKIIVDTRSLSQPKKRKVNIIFAPNSFSEYFYTFKNSFFISYNGEILSIDDDCTFTLIGQQIEYLSHPQNFTLQYTKNDEYRVSGRMENNDFHIQAHKVQITPHNQHKPNDTVAVCVTIINDDNINLRSEFLRISIKKHKKLISSFVLRQKVAERYEGTTYVDRSDIENITLQFINGKYEYLHTINGVGTSTNRIELKADDFTRQVRPFIPRLKKRIGLICLILGILLGLTIGFSLGYYSYPGIKDLLDSYHTDYHQNTHGDNESAYVCDVCSNTFSSQHELNSHMDTHPKCSECGDTFISQEELNAHIASSHSKLYSCDKCDTKFKTEEELVNHKKLKHPKLYSCDQCDLKFKTEKDLANHKKTKHPKLYSCDQCGLKFKTEKELANHKKRHHER